MFLGLFGSRSAKITQLELKLQAQQQLIESQGQLISLQVEKLDSQLGELKALQANIASLHEEAFETTLTKLNSTATADLANKVKRTITADPSFASEVASDMHETVTEIISENLDYNDLLRNVEICPSDVADKLSDNLDLDDLTERLHRQIDFDDIASRVSVDMENFSYSEVAETLSMYDLAQEISIDYDEIAHNLDYSEIDVDYERLAEDIDYQATAVRLDLDEIAKNIEPLGIASALFTNGYLEQMSLEGLLRQIPQLILDATTADRHLAEGDWTELEWAILMTVRKAIVELAQDAD